MRPTSPIRGLYAIIDPPTRPDWTPECLAEACLKGGARILQLRWKGASPETVLDHARKIAALKSRYPFTFILNDDARLALAAEADGVHLGQDDMPVDQARAILGPGKLIGKSSHSYDQAEITWGEAVDYVALGAVYPTPTKPKGHPVVGIETLARVVKDSPLPVVAIGGINRSNASEVIQAGASAFALISSLLSAPDPESECRYFSSLIANS